MKERSLRGVWWVIPLVALLSLSCSVCGVTLPFGNVEPTWPAPEPTSTPMPTQPLPTQPPPPPTQPLPPPTQPPVQPGGGDILFQDDFENPNSGWEIGDYDAGSVGYANGYYFVRSTGRGKTMWGAAFQNFTDVVIDVDTIQVLAPPNDNNDYGVVCRLQPEGDGYYFVISGDGYYAIYRAVEGEFEALVDFTPSDVIRQGNATNHLRVICSGTHLAFFVNGEPVAETDDATFAEGDIGLTATTYEDEPTEVRFDDLIVRMPRGEQVNPPPPPGGVGEVLLQDDFSDPGSGWEVGDYSDGSVGYGDGYYFVRAIHEDEIIWGQVFQNFADVVIEVDATQVLAPPNDNNAYGVMCRVQENSGYLLRVSGDGFYGIHRLDDGQFTPLVDWTASNVIQRGNATNHIRAVCDGSHLALFVNGQLVAEAEDATYTEGDIGLAVTSFEAEPTEVHFDNLVVRAAQGGPSGPPPLASSGEVLLEDDFSDPNSGWEVGDYEGGSVGYGDGYYYITVVENGKVMWGSAYREFADVVIDVDAVQAAAPANDNNAYGVMCRVQPNGDGYIFAVSGDGYYAIHRTVERNGQSEFDPLVDWTTSDVIHQGNAANHIRAICDGTHLALIVNGELLAETEDAVFTSGDIALMASTFEDEPTEIRFDNLVVTAP